MSVRACVRWCLIAILAIAVPSSAAAVGWGALLEQFKQLSKDLKKAEEAINKTTEQTGTVSDEQEVVAAVQMLAGMEQLDESLKTYLAALATVQAQQTATDTWDSGPEVRVAKGQEGTVKAGAQMADPCEQIRRAKRLRRTLARVRALQKAMSGEATAHNSQDVREGKSAQSALIKAAEEAGMDPWSMAYFERDSMSKEEFALYSRQLLYQLNPSPLPMPTPRRYGFRRNSAEYEADRKRVGRLNAFQELNQEAVQAQLLMLAPTTKGADGKPTSQMRLVRDAVEERALNQDFISGLATKKIAGLLREMAVMDAYGLYMQYEILLEERRKTRLLSSSLSLRLDQEATAQRIYMAGKE